MALHQLEQDRHDRGRITDGRLVHLSKTSILKVEIGRQRVFCPFSLFTIRARCVG